MPIVIQEIGIVGALFGGKKGKVALLASIAALGVFENRLKKMFPQTVKAYAVKQIKDIKVNINVLEKQLKSSTGWLDFWKGAGYSAEAEQRLAGYKHQLKEMQALLKSQTLIVDPKADFLAGEETKKVPSGLTIEQKKELEQIQQISKSYRKMYSEFGILTKQTYDEIKDDHKAEYDLFVLLTGDKITAQKRLNVQMAKLNKDMYGGPGKKVAGDGGRIALEEMLNARLKEMAMDRLSFFDWETDQKLGKLQSRFGQESQAYQMMTQIRLEERKNIESRLTQISSDENQNRLDLISQLNLREIKATKDSFEVRKYILNQEKILFEEKYANDIELIKEFTEVYKAEMASIDEDYKKYIEGQKDASSSSFSDMKDMFTGWGTSFSSTLNDMLWGAKTTFKDIVKEFAKMVTQMLIQKAILATMNILLPGSGTVGSMAMSVPVGHKGGIVGAGFGQGSRTTVQPSIFSRAPRLHKGLKNDEFPAILQKGEEVISKDEVKNKESEDDFSQPQITIMNVIDPAMMDQYLSTAQGRNALINVIGNNAPTIKRVLS